MDKRILTGLILSIIWAAGAGLTEQALAESPIPTSSRQLIIVVNKSYSDENAALLGYEQLKAGNWRLVLGPWPAKVGKRGMGWGLGLHPGSDSSLPAKQEGDKRSPAGVFRLGPVIGRPLAIPGLNMPYICVSEPVECVDDPHSRFYNRLVQKDTVVLPDWASAEHLALPGIWYDLGVVVEHNAAPVVPGGGSCIFLHNWESPADSTTGCTALAPENLSQLVLWLIADRQPVLVQLPLANYRHLRKSWQLPRLPVGIGRF